MFIIDELAYILKRYHIKKTYGLSDKKGKKYVSAERTHRKFDFLDSPPGRINK